MIWFCLYPLKWGQFSMPLIGFQKPAIKLKWKLTLKRPRYKASVETQVGVWKIHCSLSRSSNNMGWVLFTNDGMQNKGLDARISKATAVLRELYRSVVTKRWLSTTAKLQVFFKSVFVHIRTRILGNCGKSSISSAAETRILQSLRRDTSRQSAQLWNSWNLECRVFSLPRAIPVTLVGLREQNAPGKIGWASPAGFTHGRASGLGGHPWEGKRPQMSTKDQVAWLHLRPSLASSWCGASGHVRDCWKPWSMSKPLWSAATRPSRESGCKNEWMRNSQKPKT